MFKRKWQWALTAVIFIGIASFGLWRPKPPSEPIKIYKAVTPARMPEATEKTGTATHYRDAQPTLQDDRRHVRPSTEILSSFVDPGETRKAQTPNTDSIDSEDTDIFPPRDWYKTEDPEVQAAFFYAQLLKQFGDMPEVHTVAEYNLNVVRGVPQTLDKIEAYLEANYRLFPNAKNKKAIEDFHQIFRAGQTRQP